MIKRKDSKDLFRQQIQQWKEIIYLILFHFILGIYLSYAALLFGMTVVFLFTKKTGHLDTESARLRGWEMLNSCESVSTNQPEWNPPRSYGGRNRRWISSGLADRDHQPHPALNHPIVHSANQKKLDIF